MFVLTPNYWTMKHSWWEEKVLVLFPVTNKLHPYITNYCVNSPNHDPSIHATKDMQGILHRDWRDRSSRCSDPFIN